MEKHELIKTLIKIFFVFLLGIFIGYLMFNEKKIEIQGDYITNIETPLSNKINRQGNYSLDCSTKKYTDITIEGSLIQESSIKISNGNEKQVLYVEGKKAKYFGSEYDVIQDDNEYLVIIRLYPVSGLTETVSINKKNGIGFDTKTLLLGISGGPVTTTYLTSCYQI